MTNTDGVWVIREYCREPGRERWGEIFEIHPTKESAEESEKALNKKYGMNAEFTSDWRNIGGSQFADRAHCYFRTCFYDYKRKEGTQ